MSDAESETEVPDSRFGALVRYLTKTAVRIGIWVGLAYGVLYFLPEQTWVWWVVIAFIGISVVWAAFLRVAGIVGDSSNDE